MLLSRKLMTSPKEVKLPVRGDAIMRSEAKASRHINIVSHFDHETLIDTSGKLIQIIQLKGLDFSTKPDDLLDRYKLRRNSLWKGFSSDFGIHCWKLRKKKG
jgi:type IV secretory pathway VirB4 component